MKKINYEQRALYWGIGINLLCSAVGIIFFIWTNSQALFLDALISTILVFSTIVSLLVSKIVNKKDSKKYPLGRWAIENLFLIFRSILLFIILIYTIVNGAVTISNYYTNGIKEELDISLLNMLLYCLLMVGLTFLITIVYSYYNKKLEVKSPIINLEIKASIYDGLVTLIITICLLVTSYMEGLREIEPVFDSILVIILSLVYLITPIKELYGQFKILIDKRQYPEIEKEIKNEINTFFSSYRVIDVYYSYNGSFISIYVSLYPKEIILSDKICSDFKLIHNLLNKKYKDAHIFLVLTDQEIHKL